MATLTSSRQARIAGRIHVLQDRLQRRLAGALDTFFAAQALRVLARLRTADSPPVKRGEVGDLQASLAAWAQAYALWRGNESKATGEELLPEEERRRLMAILLPILSQAWLEAAGLAGDLVGLDSEALETDPRLARFLQDAGTQIADIHEATLRAVRQTLADGAARGYSDWQIAHGVPKDTFRGLRDVVTETYSGRADTIARTEVAIVSQQATHARYSEAGVSEVDIYDGAGCGWTSHDDGDEANGSRRTIIAAEQYPTSHPNCRRVSLPVLDR